MKQVVDEFYCTQCGKKGLPVVRRRGSMREPGHLKRLYCVFCNKEVNHVEVSPCGKYTYEMFLAERKANNFNEDGERILTYKQALRKVRTA